MSLRSEYRDQLAEKTPIVRAAKAQLAGLPSGRSLFEVAAKRDYVKPWHRGIMYIAIWRHLGLKPIGSYDEWFTTYWYVHFEPMFWRSLDEFQDFEKKFITEGLKHKSKPRGWIPEDVFIRQAEQFKTELQLKTIQHFLVPAATEAKLAGGLAKGAKGARYIAKFIDMVGESEKYADTAKCYVGRDPNVCKAALLSWLEGGALDKAKAAR